MPSCRRQPGRNEERQYRKMKILNEKNLAAYAAAPSAPADKKGWLLKRGELNKTYQRRWFVLKGNLLFYFEKPEDREPVGVIILEGCTVECSEDGDPYSFKVAFHGPGMRTYYLCAESQALMEEWMKAMSCASYDYMKVMVAELQRQVEDLEEVEKANEALITLVTDVAAANANASNGRSGSLTPRTDDNNKPQFPTPQSQTNGAAATAAGRSRLFSRLSFKSAIQNGIPVSHDLPPHLKYPFEKMHDYFKSILPLDAMKSAPILRDFSVEEFDKLGREPQVSSPAEAPVDRLGDKPSNLINL